MKKLALWQLIITVIILAAYYVVLYITDNTVFAAAAATIITAAIAVVAGEMNVPASKIATNTTIILRIVFLAAIIVALVALGIVTADNLTAFTVMLAALTAMFATMIVGIDFVDNLNKSCFLEIKKKAVWLHCSAQFIVTFAPMLINILK